MLKNEVLARQHLSIQPLSALKKDVSFGPDSGSLL
jgi:hypothetical protein